MAFCFSRTENTPRMNSTIWKLIIFLAMMPLSVLGLRFAEYDFFICTFVIIFFIGLILSTLYAMDLGRQLRQSRSSSRTGRIFGTLLGLPQIFFGGLSVVMGFSLVIWVVYNSLIKRLPEYSGGFLTFGLGPLLILVGYKWVRGVFVKNDSSIDNAAAGTVYVPYSSIVASDPGDRNEVFQVAQTNFRHGRFSLCIDDLIRLSKAGDLRSTLYAAHIYLRG